MTSTLEEITVKSVDPRPSALNITLPAFTAERGRLQWMAIDSWYASPGGRPAANQPYAVHSG